MKKTVNIMITVGVTMILACGSVSACTGFTASDGDTVLVGTNFDWTPNFDVFMHFYPPEEGKYGRVIFELNWPTEDDPDWMLPKQGLNDQGLFYDIYLTPTLFPVNSSDKPIFESDDPDYYQLAYWAYCLAKCATVAEVLDIFNQYNLEVQYFFQCFFADRNGDSVIIEGDDIVYKEGDFQVITNFLQAHPELGNYPCRRYNTAVSMLENMTELSVEYFSTICDATHQSSTIHSNVYDLREETFYIHYNNDFGKMLEFDLNEELAKGEQQIPLGPLFEPESNQPPEKPATPSGNTSGTPGIDYTYRVSVNKKDPDGDRTMFLFDWGDGSDSGWIHPSLFGNTITATHNWSKQGNYGIRVKAKDIYGTESEWSDPLAVSMPKTYENHWLQLLEKIFDWLEQIQILGATLLQRYFNI